MTKRLLKTITAVMCFLLLLTTSLAAQDTTGINTDGVNDYVRFPGAITVPTYNPGYEYSMQVWVKFTTINPTGNYCIFYNGDSRFNGSGLYLRSGKLAVLVGGVDFTTVPDFTPVAGVWYYLSLFSSRYFDGGNQSYFQVREKNVVLTTIARPGNFNSPAATDSIFLLGKGNGECSNATVDEFRIWKGRHDVADFNCQLPDGTPDLLHYYDFNEGVANGNNTSLGDNSVVDRITLNNKPGTMINFAKTGSQSNYTAAVTAARNLNRLFVNKNATGANNGEDWTNAFTSLTDALNLASLIVNGCGVEPEVWVAEGTYIPAKDIYGNSNPADFRDKTFYIGGNVNIYGGFIGNETAVEERAAGHNTILSGDIGTTGENSDNCYHVVVTANGLTAVRMDGLVITKGYANVDANVGGLLAYSGGGMYARTAALTFKNVVFINNYGFSGGGMYASNPGASSVINFDQVVFYENNAVDFWGSGFSFGGAISSNNVVTYNFLNSTITKNSATSGSAISGTGDIINFQNTIVALNTDAPASIDEAVTSTAFSLLQDDGAPDPRFRDINNGAGADGQWMTADDGLVPVGCAAIDKGNNAAWADLSVSQDIALQPRALDVNYVPGGSESDPVIDMGAYESNLTADTSLFTGAIGNAHTVPYPQQRIPDSVKTLTIPPLPAGAETVISWEQNTGTADINLTWEPAVPVSTDFIYSIPNINTTTRYRRNINVCGVDRISNLVKIKVVNPPSGVISGKVTSRNQQGVQGITIYAQKIIDMPGSPVTHIDSAVTEPDGTYVINNIFWGDPADNPSTQFRITPFKQGHSFNFPYLTKSLSFNTSNVGNVNFIDTTALVITGKVYQQCSGCLGDSIAPLDSVEMFKNGSYFSKTDSMDNGYGRYAIDVTDPGVYTILPKFNQHVFEPALWTGIVNDNINGIDFKDVTTHTISGYLKDCKNPVGIAELQFDDILPGSRPSVFKKRVTTRASDGFYSISLPARKYKISIVSFIPAGPPLQPVPVSQPDLLAFFDHYPNGDTLKIRDITNRDTILNLIYHRKPVIELTDLNDDCTTGNRFAVMKQLQPKTFTVNVWDGPASIGCPVSTLAGSKSDTVYLSTSVPAADNNPIDTSCHLNYSYSNDQAVHLLTVATITLKPGTPSITGDFFKTFNLQYQDQYGQIADDINKNIVVAGTHADVGTFTTVSPQVPLMVLHDPPGDGSSSFWSTNTSNEMAVHFSAGTSNSANYWQEVKIGTEFSAGLGYMVPTAIWGTIGSSLEVNAAINTETESVITTTVRDDFSTAGNPEVTGGSGDVFIGAALNLLYSRATEVIHRGGCVLDTVGRLMISQNGFATKYIYSEDHIKNNIIPTLQSFVLYPGNTAEQTANYQNQLNVWQQVLANNETNKERAVFDRNVSFDANVGAYTSTTETSSTKSSTVSFGLEINREVALSLGLDIGGSGISGGATVGFKMETGKSISNTIMNTTTTGYTLDDDDGGDYFTVDVKKDPVYNTPVFELVAGTTSCPKEEGTQPRDDFSVIVPVTSVSGIAANDTAKFILKIANTSNSHETRIYRLYFDQGSNPFAAAVTVGGNQAPSGSDYFDYEIPYGIEQQITITVKKGPLAVYSYEGLKFRVTDNCDGSVSKTVSLSAFFISPCSNIILSSPENNWTCSSSNNNVIPVLFKGYTLSALTGVELQYAHDGKNDWQTAFTLVQNQVVNSVNGTLVNWNVQALSDSVYSLRLKLSCATGSIYTERVTGVIDRKAPGLFGRPEPTDDQYVTGDAIGINYDEKISNTNLNNNKVTMTNLTDNANIPVQVSGYENKIAIVPVNSIAGLTGKSIRVVVKNIADIYANTKLMADTFQFIVGAALPGRGPQLNISVANASMLESTVGTIHVKFKLAQPATDDTRVNYNIAGNAVYPQDYTVAWLNPNQPVYTSHNGVQGSIMIPKNTDSAVLQIDPVDNAWFESTKNIIISLAEGGNYIIGNANVVTASILNDDAASVYTFTGNGNFSNAASWVNGQVPPAVLQTGDEIIINPSGGTCILNIPLTILPGGKLTVMAGKNLLVQGNLTIRN